MMCVNKVEISRREPAEISFPCQFLHFPLEGPDEQEICPDSPQQESNFSGKIECSGETQCVIFAEGGLCKLNFINQTHYF